MISYYNAIICRYGEIGLKGNNRRMFENAFVDNIRRLLYDVKELRVSRIRGRVWIEHKDKSCFTQIELTIIREQMVKLFGLETFSPVIMCNSDIDELCDIVKKTAPDIFTPRIENEKIISFRIRTKRSDKTFPFRSREVDIKLAEIIGNNYSHDTLKINLSNPNISVGCEIRHEFSFIYYETISGPGGLPTGSNAPIISLISGGIDSPISSYLAMKRGCSVEFITFHSSPYTPQESVDKVIDLVRILNQYQNPKKLHLCNLAPLQKIIRDNCSERYRTILYRRAMMKISTKLARKYKKQALLTGEAIGQVASQTVSNMSVIDASTDMLILRPLLGMDKTEIIKIANDINTFEISKLQVPDSCTVFAPGSPATSSRLQQLIDEENKIEDYENIINTIFNDIEKLEVNP